MIFAYYGFEISQEQIVAQTWGRVVNMPGQPGQILGNLNRWWIDRSGKRLSVQGTTFQANPRTAAQDLAADHPLIIGTRGHAMVLTDLTYLHDQYGRGEVTAPVVRDPWPARAGRRALSAQEWYSTSF
jgi:hypothetical protein